MRRIQLSLLALMAMTVFSACTDYTSKEEKAKAEMTKEGIIKAEEEAAIKEAMMQQALEDSIKAAIDSLNIQQLTEGLQEDR